MQFLKTKFAAARGGIAIRHAALVSVFGIGRTFALYGLFVVAAVGAYNSVQNVRLEREVIKLTAERDLMAHELDATLEACAQAVVDEVSNLHDKFRKIETAQAKEAKRLDELTAKLVAMSSPKAAEEAPVKSGPQTQSSPAEAIVATTVASVTPSPRRWYYLWLR